MRKGKRFRFRGLRFLGLVAGLYLLAAMMDSPQAHRALEAALKVLGSLLPILLLVILLTALINFLFHPKSLARHLGEEGGWRGWAIALSAGVLSHGPMYAWYPMIADLRRHGMRDGLTAAFFYARAVKLPLLPMMVAYFGLDFTVLLSLLTLLAAWGQGMIMDRWSSKS